MRLFVAEKPSLGRSIAKSLDGVTTQHESFIRVGQDVVTWCFGHLLKLAPPEAYDPALAKWDINLLPIRVPLDQWKLVPKKESVDQLRVIKSLLRDAHIVINAGDPDREGQLLVDQVLDYHGWKGPTFRLLMNDTTPESIRKALRAMRPNAEFAPLYAAARCRMRADWSVGMNLTRAASQRIGLTSPIGRVQTPALLLVVLRDREIENHKTARFYTLHAHVATAGSALVLVHDAEAQRIFDRKDAQRIADALAGKTVELTATETPLTERAPLPYMLSTFQKAAEERFGWGAKASVDVLQKLYENQLVSYPRTDCAYLPAEQAKLAVPAVKRILEAGCFPQAAPLVGLMKPSPRIYDDKKAAEHHGLTPTNRLPGAELPGKLRQGWELVTEQFIKSLLPDYLATKKEVQFVFEGRPFVATGETPLNLPQSWRALEPKEKAQPLPIALANGQRANARVNQMEVKEGKTTPPKPYTEASLIADMKGIAKFVKDERLRAILKKTTGIGTAATQAAIIETLKKRQYLTSEKATRGKKTYLRSTAFGRYLIDVIPPTLADPGITAVWEEALDAMAQGKGSEPDFMARIDRYVAKYVDAIKVLELPTPPPKPEPSAPQVKGRVRTKKGQSATGRTSGKRART